MPQLLLYATPHFAHILHHTRDTMGYWIQSWLLLLHFASLRPAWRKTPEVTEKQSDAKWWLGWEKFCRRPDKENIRSIHRDKMWEQTPPRTSRHTNENERTNNSNLHLLNLQWNQRGGTFFCVCVWCECATSIPLKVSTNKKIVVKNCFILAAGNGGRERAWRKNSAENIRGVCVVTSYSKTSFALLHQNCQWKVHRNVTF